MKPTPRVVSLFFLLAIVAAVLGHASQASAQATENINVPAIAFTAGDALYLEADGVIEGVAADEARAPVQFTKPGLRICRFHMWANDNDPAGGVTARLIRKRATADASSSTGPAPEPIASVSSRSASDTMRRFSTFTVSAPVVSGAYFYWVELAWEGTILGTIQVSGLRIETATACE